MVEEYDDQYQEDADEVSALICDEVWPILEGIDEEYPEHSAFFAMFVDAIHILLYQGWTLEELLREVTDHHAIHVQDEMREAGELH